MPRTCTSLKQCLVMLSLATLMACSSPIPQAPRGEGIPDEAALLALEAYRWAMKRLAAKGKLAPATEEKL